MVTGEVYDQVQLDGIYLRGGWCDLIASTPAGIVAWQWCDQEKTVAWEALLRRVPPPRVVVIDGGAGLAAALRKCWPHTRVQRCLVHVQRNCRTYLTSRPKTEAGKALWGLAKHLTRIATLEQASGWMDLLNRWFQTFGHLTKQRTYRVDTADADVPSWARATQAWWYTHAQLRKAYRLLEHLARDDVLFTYLDPEFAGLGIASTTNQIEGGVNAQLRAVARRHRGMPIDHRRRGFDWWCHHHGVAPVPLADLLRPRHDPDPTPQAPADAETATWEATPTAEEGLWPRHGWAGRSQ